MVALGGNAIERYGNVFSEEALGEAGQAVVGVFNDHGELAIAHGNGPQYGFLENYYLGMKQERSSAQIIRETQLQIGEMLVSVLRRELDFREPQVHETEVIVDPMMDPNFDKPVKGIGLWREDLSFFYERGIPADRIVQHPSGKAFYREQVPSPEPQGVVDVDSIKRMLEDEKIVICGGGGGVPVVSDGGEFKEVEGKMVIDKDLTAAIIADEISAGVFVILTKVDGYYEGYGSLNERLVPEMTVVEAMQRAKADENGAGSMSPKILAAANFVNGGEGRITVMTSSENSGLYAESIAKSGE